MPKKKKNAVDEPTKAALLRYAALDRKKIELARMLVKDANVEDADSLLRTLAMCDVCEQPLLTDQELGKLVQESNGDADFTRRLNQALQVPLKAHNCPGDPP